MMSGPGPSSTQFRSADYVQPNLGHAMRIWWAFYWRNAIISGILGVALNYAVRWIYENTHVPGKLLRPILQFGVYVLSYLTAIFIIHYVLRKRFRKFRIVLLTSFGSPETSVLELTLRRTVRVWWTYVWRTIVLSILGWVFVIYPSGMFLGLFKPSPTFAFLFFGAVGFVVGGAVALFVIYSNILDEEFGDFRVCLVAREAKPELVAAIDAKPAESP